MSHQNTTALLEARDLEISFGGIKAADGVSLTVNESEFVAIIGPNGSGKTTFLNICTGYLKPKRGSVHLHGRDITKLQPRAIARQGIARAFQIPQLFTEHTLIDNLLMSIAARRGIWQPLNPLDRPDYRAEAEELMQLLGLQDYAEAMAGTLPEGIRKLADITLAFALNPKLLVLDEPTSGVSSIERFEIMETLMHAARARGLSALFVEHDMDIVERYADRVVVWDSGTIMAEGPAAEVLKDPRVLQSVVGVA